MVAVFSSILLPPPHSPAFQFRNCLWINDTPVASVLYATGCPHAKDLRVELGMPL